jgi:hypothetical protein
MLKQDRKVAARVAALLKNAVQTPTEEDIITQSDFARRYATLLIEEVESMLLEDPGDVAILRLMTLISEACHD